jgi:CRISPR-associated protein Csm1
MLTSEQQERVVQVSLAALLHDVGKFAQRAEADPERYRNISNLGEFCLTDARGVTSYHHAAYTWQFIEDHLNWLTLVGAEEGNVAQWAARHHKPSNTWDWVVAEADRLSAGMDRGHPDELAGGWNQVKTARLTPVLARVRLGATGLKHSEETVVPLMSLRCGDEIFPSKNSTHQQNPGDYASLFEEFVRAVNSIAQGDLSIFFKSFLAVYERFAWCIPAATNCQPRDVSLFEHSRAASAIAAALAHELIWEQRCTPEAARDRDASRYLLAVADLGGIQRFLYTVVHSKAARALRGRSFGLQLIADAIGQHILGELGLPPTALLYNGGGKLWLLLPASTKEEFRRAVEEIDLGLHKTYAGRISFAAGLALMTGKDFADKRVAAKLDAAFQDLDRARNRRFCGLAKTRYGELFEPGVAGEACSVCGKLAPPDRLSEDDEGLICAECRAFIELGGAAPRARTLVRCVGQGRTATIQSCHTQLGPGHSALFAPLGLASYLLTEREDSTVASACESRCLVFAVNDAPSSYGGNSPRGTFFAGLNRAQDEEGATIDFDGLAKRSEGVERLGVLRMDVDSLGEVLSMGLPENEATVSRITNLSHSLVYFFGGYISTLIEREFSGKTQLIYSGGDDLFAVGAWSEVPRLARRVRQEFGRFSGDNPALTISCGIAVIHPKFPIAAAAEAAHENLEAAKKHVRHLGGARPKDAIAFFDSVFGWEDYDVADAVRQTLLSLFAEGQRGELLSRSVLHRLSQIAQLYRSAVEKLRSSLGAECSLADLQDAVRREKWAWHAAYAVARVTGDTQRRAELRRLANALGTTEWNGKKGERHLMWLLRPTAHWVDLLTRQRR